jgi:hypothetical protein
VSSRFITFLTDFGVQDEFVGVCHAVIQRIAGDVTLIDVTHGIPPQDVAHGAVVLARAAPYLPVGVHLAVVDPGVGSERRPVAVRTQSGSVFVGPDNGLLITAAERDGIDAVRVLTNSRYHLEPVSRTFHARDVFAPVAAHLAKGTAFDDLGDPLSQAELVRLALPEPELAGRELRGRVTTVDRFGNLASNLVRSHVDALGLASGEVVDAVLGGIAHATRLGETYADGGEGELVLLEDSSGAIELALRDGSAATLTGAVAGDELRIRRR